MGLLVLVFHLMGCGESSELFTEKKNYRSGRGAISLSNDSAKCMINAFVPSNLSLVSDKEVKQREVLTMVKDRLELSLPDYVKIEAFKNDSVHVSERGAVHVNFSFQGNGVPFCTSKHYGKAHFFQDELIVKGRFPKDLPTEGEIADLSWRSFESIDIKGILKDNISLDGMEVLSQNRCLLAIDNDVLPAWDIKVSSGNNPFRILLSEEKLYSLSPMSMHAVGEATIYQDNSLSEKLVTIKLEGLQDNGFLCSDYLTTTVDVEGSKKSFDTSHVYNYDKDDNRFYETSVFANAAKMMGFFLGIDKDVHWSKAQVDLVLTDAENVVSSGPVYTNPQLDGGMSRPKIFIPQSSSGLVNLWTDFDVVGHELGHHIISRYLGGLDHQFNILIHEGLADFFVYAKTGDSCLGESICDGSGATCLQQASNRQCLRSASNDLALGTMEYNQLVQIHSKSQLLSGFLWDLSHRDGQSLDKVAKLVYNALHYLDKRSDYKDLLESLIASDKEINNSANHCAIYDVSIDRGLSDLISKPNCQ